MKRYGLNKYDKLCSTSAIDRLFSHVKADADTNRSVMAYPLRAVWRTNVDRTQGSAVQFLISVPKKRLRHAVDRVTMRRRVREAYRLNRHQLTDALTDHIDLAFIYVADDLKDYAMIERAVNKILRKIKDEKSPEISGSLAD